MKTILLILLIVILLSCDHTSKKDTLQGVYEENYVTLYIHTYHTERVNELGQKFEIAYDSDYYPNITCDIIENNDEGHNCIVFGEAQG